MSRIAPWAGWIGGVCGWFATHQLGSDLAQARCGAATPWLMALIGLAGAAAAATGGLLSAGFWRQEAGGGVRHFIAGTGALAACLFLLAIIFQTLSAFIIPPCFG